jgi:hypothetical protein
MKVYYFVLIAIAIAGAILFAITKDSAWFLACCFYPLECLYSRCKSFEAKKIVFTADSTFKSSWNDGPNVNKCANVVVEITPDPEGRPFTFKEAKLKIKDGSEWALPINYSDGCCHVEPGKSVSLETNAGNWYENDLENSTVLLKVQGKWVEQHILWHKK